MIIHHQPVFLNYITNNLLKSSDKNILDLTLGEGGHTNEFLNLKKNVWAFDRDKLILKKARLRFKNHPNKKKLKIFNLNFSEVNNTLINNNIKIDLALFDLGISKYHYLESGQGFTFREDEPLNMNLDDQDITAQKIINQYSETTLANLFYNYGDEKYSRLCAKMIVKHRRQKKITRTIELAKLISMVYSIKKKRSKIHPATKVFQALRIMVNKELEHIELGIRWVINILNQGGRILVISYHSIEDRIVKNLFNKYAKKDENYNKYREERPIREFSQFYPKVIKPDLYEIKNNPSSRSAKMRVLIRLTHK